VRRFANGGLNPGTKCKGTTSKWETNLARIESDDEKSRLKNAAIAVARGAKIKS